MKKIITALALMAMMHYGAEAQTTECKTKHSGTMHRHKQHSSNTVGLQGRVESCRVVPYEVCKINPDRRSVSCYNTVDPYAEDPSCYNETITYGSTGKRPGEASKPGVKTIIVNPPATPDYCKRNEANNTTICYSPGDITRDEFGFYHYNFK